MSKVYDVAIIGAGAAGIFAAMEFINNSKLDVLVLEKAKRLNDSRNTGLGWFGGSARSNVHMFMESGFGGSIADDKTLSAFYSRLSKYSGAKPKVVQSNISAKVLHVTQGAGLFVDQPKTISFSEDRMIRMGDSLYAEIKEKCTLFHKSDITSIRRCKAGFEIDTNEGVFVSKYCVLSMGRAGVKFFMDGDFPALEHQQTGFDFGVKLDFPANALDAFYTKNPFFRFRFGDYKTSVVSFGGSLELEEVNQVKIANIRNLKGAKSGHAFMSLLYHFNSDTALNSSYRLCEITNLLSEPTLMREPISKWLNNTNALSALPEMSYIRDGLEQLVELLPELKSKVMVYGPDARLNAVDFKLSKSMESSVPRMYVVGDMSGKTHSFVQAACSGIIAAQAIIKKTSK